MSGSDSYVVLVEYWDDEEGAKLAAVGPYPTWDEAREARDELEETKPYEYVRNVVAIIPDPRTPEPGQGEAVPAGMGTRQCQGCGGELAWVTTPVVGAPGWRHISTARRQAYCTPAPDAERVEQDRLAAELSQLREQVSAIAGHAERASVELGKLPSGVAVQFAGTFRTLAERLRSIAAG